MTILRFPPQRRNPDRACTGCGSRFPKDAPTYWKFCSRCYGYGMFRKAVESFRAVRP